MRPTSDPALTGDPMILDPRPRVRHGRLTVPSDFRLEHFTMHGDYLDMKLSPDGKHIAARVRADIGVVMIVLETKTMTLISTLRPRENG